MSKNDKMVPKPDGFPAVRKAREALKEQAMELLLEYRDMIKQAAAAGKFAEALNAQQWLLDHLPAEDKQRIFDQSVDKTGKEEGPAGPSVVVAFKLGRVNAPLPEVIDIEPED